MIVTATATERAVERADSAVFKCRLQDGSEASIWASKNTDMAVFLQVCPGDTVELNPGQKAGKYFFKGIAGKGQAPAAPANQRATYSQPSSPSDVIPEMSRVEKPEMGAMIADYVARHAKLYAHIHSAVQVELGPAGDGESVRSAATTIYIQTVRKFNL